MVSLSPLWAGARLSQTTAGLFFFQKATPDWDYYIQQGFHKSNLPTIQAINKFEFDPDIIRLSTGEISEILMPHEAISSVLIELSENPKAYSYLEPLGLYELRLALCQYLKRYNLNVDPSEILIVSGSLQALTTYLSKSTRQTFNSICRRLFLCKVT